MLFGSLVIYTMVIKRSFKKPLMESLILIFVRKFNSLNINDYIDRTFKHKVKNICSLKKIKN